MRQLFLFGSEGRIAAYGLDGPVVVYSSLQMGVLFILIGILLLAVLYLVSKVYDNYLKSLKIPP
jgi:hypothetical protein